VVNNAGLGHEGTQEQVEPNEIEQMINVMALTPVYLTKALLPRLIESETRCGIINVASTASLMPMPGLANYAMVKVFLSYFSRAVNFEL
jgi:short-subunit dehydrogenase